MEAIRRIVPVDNGRLTLELPAGFPAKEVEVIILPADVPQASKAATPRRRQPAPQLKGTRIIGDLLAPAAAETDWDLLK